MESEPKRKPTSREIAAHFRAEIAAGTYSPGAKLPGAKGHAQKLGVAVMTVQTAYSQLNTEGLTEGVPGSGTYVRDPAAGKQGPREAAQSVIDLQADVARMSTELAGLVERVKQLEDVVNSIRETPGT
ncbi:GntR family transcriptional regulator [Streptomyces sp. SDT5-1]|uniref:GntR family transcriptional regulator n=1 Tax=Streptomyces sp. SDT5-1 TaxID=3406418 RepID=UPI003FD462C4